MPLVALSMEQNTHRNAVRPVRKLSMDFQPPSLCGSSLGSPTSPAAKDSMNFLPRHSCKPSSLLSSRNINIQRLLLNSSLPESAPVVQSPRRGKPLALFIPSVASPTQSFTVQTPIREVSNSSDSRVFPLSANHESPYSSVSSGSGNALESHKSRLGGLSERLRSPFKSGGSLPDSQEELSLDPSDRETISKVTQYEPVSSPVQENSCTAQDPSDGHPVELQSGIIMPEELQEIGLTSAYSNGPANVLNSVLYLYSDPENSETPIDINDYDLVVNVARECKNLHEDFDEENGAKKYLRVPWTHTSTILKELPMITREIAKMDKPGKKVLIHCQCGVLRSACVVVAYFMTKFKISVNEAYELLKTGTNNETEACSQKIKESGNYVEACERICPNMSLIFELMDFGEKL